MLFTEVLEKHGLTPDTVSHGIKVKIRRYNSMSAAVEKAKAELPNAKTQRAKEETEKQITTGQETMAQWNEEICNAVENFVKNKETNKKKAENLAKMRETKAEKAKAEKEKQKDQGGTAAAKVVEMKESPKKIETIELETEEVHDPPAKVEKKKGSGVMVGVVVGLLGLIGLGAIAYKVMKKD